MTATYRHDYKAFQAEVLQADFMEAEMLRRASKVKALAEETAPVGDPAVDPHSGRYKASFYISSTKEGGLKKDRAVGIVGNSSPDAILVEYVDGHHTLVRSLDAAGG